jgi:hypothetical protein
MAGIAGVEPIQPAANKEISDYEIPPNSTTSTDYPCIGTISHGCYPNRTRPSLWPRVLVVDSIMRQFRLLAPMVAFASICCYGQCPLKFESVDPSNNRTWGNFNRGMAQKSYIPEFKVKVQNVSGKDIRGLKVQAAYYDATEDMHAVPVAWNWQYAIKTGAETTLHWANTYYHETGFVGWLVLPVKILFEDGSTWDAHALKAPESMEGCFGEYWRDKKHPRLTVLPPELLKTPGTDPPQASQ